jgi:hypothetical protein
MFKGAPSGGEWWVDASSGIAMAFGTMRHEGGVGWSMCWNAMIPR